jgi:hypothetical protein
MHIQKRKIYEEYSIRDTVVTVSVELELVGQVLENRYPLFYLKDLI